MGRGATGMRMSMGGDDGAAEDRVAKTSPYLVSC